MRGSHLSAATRHRPLRLPDREVAFGGEDDRHEVGLHSGLLRRAWIQWKQRSMACAAAAALDSSEYRTLSAQTCCCQEGAVLMVCCSSTLFCQGGGEDLPTLLEPDLKIASPVGDRSQVHCTHGGRHCWCFRAAAAGSCCARAAASPMRLGGGAPGSCCGTCIFGMRLYVRRSNSAGCRARSKCPLPTRAAKRRIAAGTRNLL